MSGDCLFCAIVARRSPASFVYEDEHTAAFMDLFPVNAGHTLVVPKRHADDLLSCPPEAAARLFEVCARIAPAIVRAVDAEGFNIWVANGEAAGQEVFHLHLHLLPRRRADSFGLRFPKGYPREASRSELDDMARSIRAGAEPE